MKKTTLRALAGASVLVVGYVAEGEAQTADELSRGASVLDRPRPELDPLGVRAGSFLVFPRVEAGVSYETNVFAEPEDEDDDFLFVVNPSVAVRSDFSRHALAFEAGAEFGRYADLTSENFFDYEVAGSGRLDVGVGGAATARLAHIRNHEDRGDPDQPTAAVEPVEYSSTLGEVGYSQRFNRVTAGVSTSAEWLDYDDVGSAAGPVIDQDDRDRWVYSTNVRVGYLIQPRFEAYVRGTYNVVEYDQEQVDRDSQGYEIAIGSDFDLTGLITGTAYVGYLSRDFDNEALDDPSGMSFGLDLDWAATQLTTVRATASRSLEEPTGFGSRERTRLGVGADHELLRNLILSADAVYRIDEFNDTDREDDYYSLGVGALYTLNRNYYARAGYVFETRNSNVNARDYDNNVVTLRLGARL